VVDALAQVATEVVAVGRADTVAGVPTLPDLRPGRLGPLAGLETSLVYGGDRDVLLVAVDQPFLVAATLRSLVALPGEAVVPVAGDVPQVTCAVYRSPCLAAVRAIVATSPNPRLQEVLHRVATRLVPEEEWRRWGEDGRSWCSIDTPEALARAETAYLSSPGAAGGDYAPAS